MTIEDQPPQPARRPVSLAKAPKPDGPGTDDNVAFRPPGAAPPPVAPPPVIAAPPPAPIPPPPPATTAPPPRHYVPPPSPPSPPPSVPHERNRDVPRTQADLPPSPSPSTGQPTSASAPRWRRAGLLLAPVLLVVVVVVVVISASGSPHHTNAGLATSNASALPAPAVTVATLPPSSASLPPATTTTTIVANQAGTDPTSKGVDTTLERYFDAINAHDWTAAWNLFTPSEQATVPVSQLSSEASTTEDTDIVLSQVDPQSSSQALADVSFESNQNPAYSPDGQACDAWHLSYSMQQSGSQWLIESVLPGSQPYQPC